jgi:uncharacterized repeat protein (TIGR01451 family)
LTILLSSFAVSLRPQAGALQPTDEIQTERITAPSDTAAIEQALASCPLEFTAAARQRPVIVSLPMSAGGFRRYAVVESPVMEPELAAKYPRLRTYRGHGLDDPSEMVRFTMSPLGLQAHVFSQERITPIVPGSDRMADWANHNPVPRARAACQIASVESEAYAFASEDSQMAKRHAVSHTATTDEVILRTYRLALATTGEFAAQHGGGTVEGTLAAMVTLVNQANAIFERDLGFRLILAANTDRLIFTDAQGDPYSKAETSVLLLDENQEAIDRIIGTANYDVGCVLVPVQAGIADLAAVCRADSKAKVAVAGDLIIFLHEFGHAFGSHHSLNGIQNTCGPRAAPYGRFEPGRGSTIMSFVGPCDSDNLQSVHDLYYHSGSIDQIRYFVEHGDGAGCAVTFRTGNRAPTVHAGSNRIIPKGTPFTLTAEGQDPDGGALTYCWEERDFGPQVALSAGDNGASPLFRSFPPSTNPTRTFPQWSDILNNRRTPGERLPTRERTMKFRVTVRDNQAGGGLASDETEVTVDANAGPFSITSPNTAVTWSGQQTVTWDVAGTTNAPMSATSVNILLSTNGGLDFPIVLGANTPNDGSEKVLLPELYTTAARIKIEAVDNIFFNVNSANFTIVSSGAFVRGNEATLVAESCTPFNRAIDPGETVTLQCVFENVGSSDALNAIAELVSDPAIKSSGPAQKLGQISANGGRATNSFTLTVNPDLVCGRAFVARFAVRADAGMASVAEFPVRLGHEVITQSSLTNDAPIVLANVGPAGTYPSPLLVAGLSGTLSKVGVTLNGLSAGPLQALQLLLVAPSGQTVLLMEGAGGNNANAALNLTLDSDATKYLPAETAPPSGRYRPTSYPHGDRFEPPAPPGHSALPNVGNPYGTDLALVTGSNPNGVWQLFARNVWSESPMRLARGWRLDLTTTEIHCCNRGDLLALHLVDDVDPAVVNQPTTWSVSVTNVSPNPATGVVVTNVLPEGLSAVSVTTSQGTASIADHQVVCDLGTLTPGTMANIAVTGRPMQSGVVNFVATVTSREADSSLANNTAVELTTVQEQPALAVNDVTVSEGNSGNAFAEFAVTHSEPTPQVVSVVFATSDGTATAGADYVATNGLLRFQPGEFIKSIRVTVPGDTIAEETRTFFVTLHDSVNAGILRAQGIGTITDALDHLRLTANDVTINRPASGSSMAIVPVKLSGASTDLVTVRYATESGAAKAGVDFMPVSGELAFKPGETKTSIAIPVPARCELLDDQQSFLVRFSEPHNAILATSQVFVVISNISSAPIPAVVPAQIEEGDSGTTSLSLTVTLPRIPGTPQSPNFYTLPGTATPGVDYEPITGVVWFGVGQTNATVTIPIFGDTEPEPDETFYVVVGGDPSLKALATIVDDDEPRVFAAEVIDGKAHLSFHSRLGLHYEIQFADSLEPGAPWKSLPGSERISGTGGTVRVADTLGTGQLQRFYRIQQLP